VAVILLVFLVPIGLGVWTSLQVEGSTLDRPAWAGLRNYARLFADPAFPHSLLVSAIFTAATVSGTYGAGLATAVLLHRRFPGQALLSAAAIVPWAMPYVAAAMIWSWLLDYQYGLLTYLLSLAGLAEGRIGWLTDPRLALWAVIVVQVWKLFPLATVFLLAGLKTIPADQLQAARVDGAGAVRAFRYVVLPALRPITLILVLLLTIWVFGRSFTVIYVLTGGGPVDATQTLVLLTFQLGFTLFHLNTAAALGTVIMVISGFFAVLYWRFLQRPAA
jgi:multiple sugar transport system permease protein